MGKYLNNARVAKGSWVGRYFCLANIVSVVQYNKIVGTFEGEKLSLIGKKAFHGILKESYYRWV